MAYHYVRANPDQLFLLPTSMRDWLEEGHLAWFVIDVVARIDTAAFHARHPNDGAGRPAHDPDLMLALLFYAYGVGLRSSRRIEAACRTDAAFRVIARGLVPDHATIARFLVDHEAAIEATFVEVLRLCAAAGLVAVDTLAIDGTKMGTNAALGANHRRATIEDGLARLRAEVAAILAEAKATDATEDDRHAVLFGLPQQGEPERLPRPLATRRQREARLEQALAVIAAEEAAAAEEARQQAAKAAEAAANGQRLLGRKPKDPHAALARAEVDAQVTRANIDAAVAARAARRDAKVAKAAAEGRKPGLLPRTKLYRREERELKAVNQRLVAAREAAASAQPTAHQANTTDPDSRIMKTHDGWVQGYNAQATTNEGQIVLATMVSQDANDVELYQPMVTATQASLAGAGVTDPIGMALADAGYWSDDNATAAGPDRLIATRKDWKQRRAARDLGTTTGPPPEGASTLEAMEHRLRTAEGAARYALRSHAIEPVFGHTKHNRGQRELRRRGLRAARSEWALMNTVHNITKLFDHQVEPDAAPG